MWENAKKVKHSTTYLPNSFKRGNFTILDLGWENERDVSGKKVQKLLESYKIQEHTSSNLHLFLWETWLNYAHFNSKSLETPLLNKMWVLTHILAVSTTTSYYKYFLLSPCDRETLHSLHPILFLPDKIEIFHFPTSFIARLGSYDWYT